MGVLVEIIRDYYKIFEHVEDKEQLTQLIGHNRQIFINIIKKTEQGKLTTLPAKTTDVLHNLSKYALITYLRLTESSIYGDNSNLPEKVKKIEAMYKKRKVKAASPTGGVPIIEKDRTINYPV